MSIPVKPGCPSGVDRIIETVFCLPLKPVITRLEALELIRDHLIRESIPYERLSISMSSVPRGGLFNALGRRVRFPDGLGYNRCFVAFVNPDIRAKWAHPAHFAFVSVDGCGDVVLIDTNMPPHNAGLVRLISEEKLNG